MKRYGLLLALLALTASAKHAHVIVPRRCLTDIHLTDHTECSGPDQKHLTCKGVVIDFGCVEYK